MVTYRFDHLLTATRWLSPGYVSFDVDGRISKISERAPAGDYVNVGGIAVPGVANLHSHAFQRGMAGLSEFRTAAEQDSFWTWRDLMYRFVDRLSPDDLEAIASQLYVEMLKAGFTSVGEFQYLHHDRDGTPFGNPAEMSLRTLAAAKATGIGITMLPVLYQYAGFGEQPARDGQRRFINDPDRFLDIYRVLDEATAPHDNFRTGIAPHSLRAAGEDAIRDVVAEIAETTPIHIHIAEQEQEVSDCVAFSGLRPVQYLLDRVEVDERWCLIHATHMTAEEAKAAAISGSIAGLCPTTEANLGDGLFDMPGWRAAAGAIGIGSDSHISVSIVEELRWLEYGQRLRDRRRNIAADAAGSSGTNLLNATVSGGARALGRARVSGEIGLAAGALADIVVLDLDAPTFAGHKQETFIDAWLFSGNSPLVTDVFAGGVHVIRDGAHPDEEAIAIRYHATLSKLLSE